MTDLQKFQQFTVAFAGIVASGVMVIAIAWCVEMKGPLLVSSYTPMMLFLVVFGSSYVLDEKLFRGSMIGAVLIVLGLYLVLWGKKQDVNKMKAQRQHSNHPTTTQHDQEAI